MEEFERLLRAYYGPLERFVKYRLSGTGDAEDLLQEVCLTAYEKYHTLRDPAKFKPWILQIARNKCLNYFRAKRPEHISLDTVELCLTDSLRGPVEAVQDTLSLMREQDRAVLTLTYFDGLSQTEIAGRLQIPVGTVKSRMYAAKNRFRSIYPTASKGNDSMKNLPNIMPEYTITRSAEAPFPVKWEELMGWFIVPREGETCKWAMYEFPSGKRTMYVDMAVQGKARVHGIDGVRIRGVEHDPVLSEQIGDQKDVERFFVAQLTDTHCRLLAESHTNIAGVQEYFTFLDGDDFLENWGFGPDNCGNETKLCQKGLIRLDGNELITGDTDWPMDIVGRYTVTIHGKRYDTVCVWDVECYEYQNGVCSQQFVDRNGRTVLWRRFNRDDWAFHHFGKHWTELLPDNERVTINGQTYVHWYDCITDYILG